MTASQKHDPLNAIAESEATGETAEIFADIRATMRLPLLTSIWRTLAGVEGGLQGAWKVAKPIFESGYPDILLARIRDPSILPIPSETELKELRSLGVSRESFEVLRHIVDIYTRSNSLNLLVLSAMFAEPAGSLPPDAWRFQDKIVVPKLPRLMEQSEIDPSTWQLILDVNQFGAYPDEPGLATLWRHMAYWPEVLSIIHDALLPLQEEQVISRSVAQVLEIARLEGSRLAAICPAEVKVPETARMMIEKYVTHPGLVARMVAIGNGLSLWLRSIPV